MLNVQKTNKLLYSDDLSMQECFAIVIIADHADANDDGILVDAAANGSCVCCCVVKNNEYFRTEHRCLPIYPSRFISGSRKYRKMGDCGDMVFIDNFAGIIGNDAAFVVITFFYATKINRLLIVPQFKRILR